MSKAVGFDYRSEVVRLTQEMLRVDTVNPPGNEAHLAELIAERLRTFGVPAHLTELASGRANVTGRVKGCGGRPALLINGHLDTVPPGETVWKHAPFSGDLADGRLHGRGAADMKGGLAAAVVTAGLLAQEAPNLKGDFIVAGTAGEEVDSLGARRYVEDEGLDGVGLVVVGEPTGLQLALAEKGTLWVSVTTHGRTAHGSMPQCGVNAIAHMNLFLTELAHLNYHAEHPVLGQSTLNIGTISGGVKTNVVPDRCRVTLDFRTVPGLGSRELAGRLESLVHALNERIPDFLAEVEVINAREPVALSPTEPLVSVAQAVGRKALGRHLEPGFVPFYTDAAVFAEVPGHPPIFIIGPGAQEMAHQPDEHVDTAELIAAVEFYYELARTYLAGQ